MREKHSQQGVGDMERWDMSYGAAQIERCSQGRQKCSMQGRWKGESVVNAGGTTTKKKGAPL